MHSHAEQTNDRPLAASIPKQSQVVNETRQHEAFEGEATNLETLNAKLNSSPGQNQLKALSNNINNSPRQQQLAQLQAKLNAKAGNSIQQKAGGPASPQTVNKTGLPDNLKSGIENLSGYSMDDVKVHYNSDKPAQLNAHAYAQGTDIHMAPGQERHLPHEAWHVVQQKQGKVKPTMQMNGKVNVNNNAGLEKEADVMGSKAFQTVQRHSSVQLKKSSRSGSPVIQPMMLYRYMNLSENDAWTANSNIIDKDISEIAATKEQLTLLAEKHKENIDAPDSPFISLTMDPAMAAEAGSLKTIIENAPSIVPFNIPEKYVVPLTNEVSLREGEMLVWLPKGVTLLNFLVSEESATGEILPTVWPNRYKGLDLKEIEQLHNDEGFFGAKLEPIGPDYFVHRKLNEEEGANWRSKRDERDRRDKKVQDNSAHRVQSNGQTIDLNKIIEMVKNLYHQGMNKEKIIQAILSEYPKIPPNKVESFYNIGIQ